jgi:hypothetical protein
MKRVFSIASGDPPSNLWMRAAVGGKIQERTGGWYSVDDRWRIRIDPSAKPVLRKSGDNMELLVPIRFRDGRAAVEHSYAW